MTWYWWILLYFVASLPVTFFRYCLLSSALNIDTGELIADTVFWPFNLPVIMFLLAKKVRGEKVIEVEKAPEIEDSRSSTTSSATSEGAKS